MSLVNEKSFYCKDYQTDEVMRARLQQLEQMGVEIVGYGELGIPGHMSGMYIERVWYADAARWEEEIKWIQGILDEMRIHTIPEYLRKAINNILYEADNNSVFFKEDDNTADRLCFLITNAMKNKIRIAEDGSRKVPFEYPNTHWGLELQKVYKLYRKVICVEQWMLDGTWTKIIAIGKDDYLVSDSDLYYPPQGLNWVIRRIREKGGTMVQLRCLDDKRELCYPDYKVEEICPYEPDSK